MKKEFSKYFDHTLLNPSASLNDIKNFCKEANDLNVYSVCINPYWIQEVDTYLKKINSNIKICSVISFPFGLEKVLTKKDAIRHAVFWGSDEVDYVINQGKINNLDYIEGEMYTLSLQAHQLGLILNKDIKIKAIIETSNLTDEQIINIANRSKNTGVDFLKTSTGYSKRGASYKDISLLNMVLKDSNIKIKASGGIKTLEQVNKFIELGADRIGSSSSKNIILDYHKNIGEDL